MNKVLLKGRIVTDLKSKGEGSPCEFSVMTRDEWKGDRVEGKNNNEFHICVVWGTKGDWAKSNLVKGDIVFIEGFLKHTKLNYTIKDDNGKPIKVDGKDLVGSSIKTEIKVKNIEKI